MLELKKNEECYWNFIREVRSDPRNEEGFLERVRITEEQQRKYMEKHNDEYYVCLNDGILVGFIGSVDGDIRLGVDFEKQGKGIATFMLNEFTKLINPDVDKAKILHSNLASQKLFKNCGYVQYHEDSNFKYYKYES